jgi:Ca2+-binding RTX toxin-like protein
METIMKLKYNIGAAATVAGVAASLAFLAGPAFADPALHTGDPSQWGPPLEALCNNPIAAAADGYNVIVDDETGGLVEGTNGPDAIYSAGGNDIVNAGGGNDLVCASFGNDTVNGEGGNDALFGQGHNDTVNGGRGRDFVSGDTQTDVCEGGAGADAADASCETVL